MLMLELVPCYVDMLLLELVPCYLTELVPCYCWNLYHVNVGTCLTRYCWNLYHVI